MVTVIRLSALAFLAALTFAQNGVWRSERQVWTNAVHWAPLKPRPYINLGRALEAEGDDQGAFEAYERALVLSAPDHQRLLAMAFTYAAAQTNIAHLYAKHDEPAVARYLLDAVLREQPFFATAIFNKSVLLARAGQCDDAVIQWQFAVSLDPSLPPNPCAGWTR